MEAASMVVESQEDIEDGEIFDAEYTPLPRPANFLPSSSTAVNTTRIVPPPISSDEHESSESDSDSDSPRLPKAPRLRKLPIPSKPVVPAKYTIWNQNLQEDTLNEQLLNCDVDLKYDKSRDVESYDYIGHRTNFPSDRPQTPVSDDEPVGNKRRHGDLRNRLNRKPRPERREVNDGQSSGEEDRVGRPKPRFLAELKVDESNTEEEVTLDVANKLWEEKESLVGMAVKVLGIPRVIRLFNKVRDIEEDGGMMILNGARRRTPGGVFFYLLRSEPDVTRDQHDAIFANDVNAAVSRKRRDRRRRQAAVDQLRAAEATRLEAALPELLTRAEELAQRRERGEEELEEGEERDEPEAIGSNPPPSPAATDGNTDRDDAIPLLSDVRQTANYDDDDFLDVNTSADMDMF